MSNEIFCFVNNEIESKIKILNGNKKENLVFKKKFDNLGINVVNFIIEGELNDMSYMFNNCSSLIQVVFNSIDTRKVNNMQAMFYECRELEYLDLSNFDTSNVTLMSFMFHRCHKLKEIIGINKFGARSSDLCITQFHRILCNVV